MMITQSWQQHAPASRFGLVRRVRDRATVAGLSLIHI